ncbi:MAG TPA: ribosome maturation factor RimP [Thermopetrobacter sp.]|nr:ribosome maturation factor RimP [Thermopetrobacter sp.]
MMEVEKKDRRIARESGPAAAVAKLAGPLLEGMGFRLVRVRFAGRDLQVMAERPDGSLTIDDCAAISRALSPLLDVEDPVPGRYNLEISSPGVARPLVRPADFETWAGHEAKIEMATSIDGRKRFRGVLEGFDEDSDEVRLFLPAEKAGGEKGDDDVLIGLKFADIASARLVMSDALLNAAAKAAQRSKSLTDGAPPPDAAAPDNRKKRR